jgi:hypothetical protein
MSDCWARSIGGCGGGMTGEHIFSRGVVPGSEGDHRRRPWLPKDSLTIGIESAVANILCADHNHQLGAEVDHVAKGLREAIAESVRNRPASIGSATPWITTGGGVLTPRPQLRVSGKAYARWLCKTHCNVMVTAGHTPAVDYVRYAFDKTPRAHLYFYFATLQLLFDWRDDPPLGQTL